MLILATVVAQRIIVARPLAIGPRLGPLAFTVAARRLLALLLVRRATRCRSSTAAAGEATSARCWTSIVIKR